MSEDKLIIANAFGGDFPVCTEKDKVAIEDAFKKAMEWTDSEDGKAYDESDKSCACELITRLLNGTASRGDQVTLGIDMARAIYTKKMAAVALMQLIGGALGRGQEIPDMPSLNPTKKEWVN
jgi:hypothetical protein